jgi:nuclear receptor subfamily 1 group F protein 4
LKQDKVLIELPPSLHPYQILLLKTGSFELAIIRMSRLMDLSQNAVLYGDVMLSQDVFYTSNTIEMKLVAGIFETAKSIAELKLTETELALYQSLVLLWPGKNVQLFSIYFSANDL